MSAIATKTICSKKKCIIGWMTADLLFSTPKTKSLNES